MDGNDDLEDVPRNVSLSGWDAEIALNVSLRLNSPRTGVETLGGGES